MSRSTPGDNMKKFGLFWVMLVCIVALSACGKKSYQNHFDLGKWYSEKGLTDEAILEFKAATQSDSDQYEAHLHLAIAYTKKGWYEYAIKEAEIAFDLHPSDQTYKLIQLIRDKRSLSSYQDLIESE